jgi:hypothetical protein
MSLYTFVRVLEQVVRRSPPCRLVEKRDGGAAERKTDLCPPQRDHTDAAA